MTVTTDLDIAFERLVHSPRLKLYTERFEHILDEERIRREAFYDEVPDDVKAEFINGEVVFHMPVKLKHSQALRLLLRLIDAFVTVRGLGLVGFEKLLVSLTRNDYEPDICFFVPEKAAELTPDQTRFPAPDLIVEILSDSTEARDRGIKFEDYAAHGVAEYWIVDPESKVVEQYVLDGERYALRLKAGDGTLRSTAIPGFVIPIRAIFDESENLATLRQILASPA